MVSVYSYAYANQLENYLSTMSLGTHGVLSTSEPKHSSTPLPFDRHDASHKIAPVGDVHILSRQENKPH